ncbi:choice-of-anchor A family protein [Streptomyces sp. NPDC051555]|uniref:choice-of-anchor A family protein n=1 Tax=Streptomyces sp. NPDC051555 TaxID=3365657 RepID=UPI0037BB1F2E
MRASTALATAIAAVATGTLALVPAATATAAVAAPPVCAQGAAGPLGLAGVYAEFVEGDAVRYADSEGAVAVGGNATFGDAATGQGFSVGAKLSAADLAALPGGKSLVVGGELTANQVVIGKGAGVYGSLKNASKPGGFAIDGQHAKGASPVDFAKTFAQLRAGSNSWAALKGTGSVSRPEGSKSLLLTGEDAKLNVFTVDAAELQKADRIALKVPAGSSTIVNVLGAGYDMSAGHLYGVELWDPQAKKFVMDDYDAGSAQFKEIRSRLLWNFPQATSVKKNRTSWPGTILAPNAAVQLGSKGAGGAGETGPGHVNGSVIAKRLTSVPGAETHQMNFRGCLPGTGGGGTGQPIPPAPKPSPTSTTLPPAPKPTPSKPATTKPGTEPSTKPSGATPSGSASPSAQPSGNADGSLATTGGGVDSKIVLGAVGALLVGGACLATAALRRRAGRR